MMNTEVEITKLNGQIQLVVQKQDQTNAALIELKNTTSELNATLSLLRGDITIANNVSLETKKDLVKAIERIDELEVRVNSLEDIMLRISTIYKFLFGFVSIIGLPTLIYVIGQIVNAVT